MVSTIDRELFPSAFSLANIGVVLCCLLLYSIGLVVYRLYFHPLAKFPGPKVAAATKWYEFYFDVLKMPGGQFYHEINKMHDKYGPIVRVTPDELHIKDSEFYEVLYCAGSAIRDKYKNSALFAGTPLGIFGTIKHDIHRSRRAPIGTYFSQRAVRSFEPILHAKLEELCEQMMAAKATGEVVDLRVNYLAFTTDMITTYGFGNSLNLMKDRKKAKEWLRTAECITATAPFLKQYPNLLRRLMPFSKPLVRFVYPTAAPVVNLQWTMKEWASKAIQDNNEKEYLQSPAQPGDGETVFQAILRSTLPPEEKSEDRLAQDGFLVIFGGGDPASRTLTLAAYFLLAHPLVLARLQEELDALMPNPKVMASLKELEQLPYLTAVIKEINRVLAVSTSRLEMVCPVETLQYKQWTIAPGTPIGMTIHDVLHDESIFPDPLSFRPERWLEQNDATIRQERYYVPFGRGHRMCVGRHFGMSMLYMTMAAMVRRFEFELVDCVFERDIKIIRDQFIGEPSPESKGVRVRVVKERP